MFLDGLKSVHLLGTQGLYTRVTTLDQIYGGGASKCSSRFPNYCMAVRVPPAYYLSVNIGQLTFSVFLCGVVSFISCVLLKLKLQAKGSLSERVRRGLVNGDFFWLYQPIVNIATGEVVGCEALARLKDRYGTLLPETFIPVIRQLDLTWDFTQLMVDSVFDDLRRESDLPEGFRVSINIFPRDIESGRVRELPEMNRLRETRFKVCLEVTEDEYLDSPTAHDHIRALAMKGFYISIDDFGTGYSNLKNLATISFHQLKIDRMFVRDIVTEGLKTSVIPNIMDIVLKFGYGAVAEGIETREQELMLKKAGVNFGQGHLYGEPMTTDRLARLFRKSNAAAPLPSGSPA